MRRLRGFVMRAAGLRVDAGVAVLAAGASISPFSWPLCRFRRFATVLGDPNRHCSVTEMINARVFVASRDAYRLALPSVKAIRRFTVRTVLPDQLRQLEELVLNLRWSWHHETLDLFRSVDPELWETVGHDPVRLLGEVSSDRLAALAADRRFLRLLDVAVEDLRDYLTAPRWYQSLTDSAAGSAPRTPPEGQGASGASSEGFAGPAAIAYFSPEYGIAAALPQYSGGLGILAGDHLKTASDRGGPIRGGGLLSRHASSPQSLPPDGGQRAPSPPIDPNGLPLTLL